ncbi:Gfo/Idh/MocA family oxidoreductase [Haloferula sargassicola]|uniref:Inositol 2-dehydrogenase/D-chiro-inositol 3-dehydrogenase n=1 Tax=Haloferula sargassicola TaxID=490096 RepID=A0ABP9US36_9BACT
MNPLSRRQTLKGLAALATIQIVPSRVLGLNGQTAPSNELTKGIIGCGGISASHLTMPGKLLALCDVDRHHLDQRMKEAGGEQAGVTGYHDFRELIARDDIDIVHIATPPHWHGLMSIAAARAGKDIWCEKPMTRTIGEGIAVAKAVQDEGRIFRINTWFRFQGGFYGMKAPVKLMKKAILADMFGWPLKFTVSASTGFDWKFQWVGQLKLPLEPVPDYFDYDLWLGPAPAKPYHHHRTHQTFRGYWDYDSGGLGDMGQHYLDPIQYMLDKDGEAPVSVEIDADPQDADAVGTWRRIELTYADGCKVILDGEDRDKDAAYIEGPKGKLMKGFESDIPDFRAKVRELPDPPPQNTDFHECVRERKPFALNEDNAFWSTTMLNMAVTAHRLNRSLKFDSKTLTFDDDEANDLIRQPMRGPWSLDT